MFIATLCMHAAVIDTIDGSDFQEGARIKIHVAANYNVASFGGTKALVITTLAQLPSFGGGNIVIAKSFVSVGVFCLVIGLLLLAEQGALYFRLLKKRITVDTVMSILCKK